MSSPSETSAQHNDSIGRYLLIYVCILGLAAIQFFIAYSHIDTQSMLTRMLLVAVVEAALAVLFFMHLWAERRGFLLFVIIITVFVTLVMQFGWTDSNRMINGVPYAQTKASSTH